MQNGKPTVKSASRLPKEFGGRFPLCKLGKGLSCRLMEITPQLAQMWLDKIPQFQRKASQSAVKSIARLILADKWELNGQTFVLNRRGECINGCHRAAAIVLAGKAVWALVVYGVNDEAYKTMDAGRIRHPSDALKSAGYKCTLGLSAAAHILWNYEDRGAVRPDANYKKITPLETVEIVQVRPDLAEAIHRARPCFEICKSQAVPIFCNYIFHKINPDQCAQFFEKLYTGEDLGKGHPILELRRRLMAEVNPGKRTRMWNHEMVHLIFKAWNLVRKNQTTERLMIGAKEDLPVPI